MAKSIKSNKTTKKKPIEQYEHKDKKRTNNPPVGLVTSDTDNEVKEKTYSYDPHLDPQLVWAGKAERTSFDVDTVSLHVHERIDPRTIIEAVRKKNGSNYEQMSMFSSQEENPPLRDAVDFYKHKHNWSNRLIAGDSLLIMNSLIEKEGLAGQVQMIYIDPPYGIKYGSNFQPFTNKHDVKDGKDEDLNQEPEMIKAFRDTWELGIHSYLSYLRDRLLLARELLHESGSVFVQISDENVHYVRSIMDEIYGRENFIAEIVFKTATNQNANRIQRLYDNLIWYGKSKEIKFHKIFRERTKAEVENIFDKYDEKVGKRFKATEIPANYSSEEIKKLKQSDRIYKNKYGKRFEDDFMYTEIDNVWRGTIISTFSKEKVYVVQTSSVVIERCILMTTDPGDLVLDPTCGSGVTAYVAENLGRRWITCDTSRVAVTLAKQRLMTALYDYYELAHPEQGVGSGFNYKTVPHITLKSIANDEPPATETLYDQPKVDNSKTRVTGPFTVEAVPSQVVKPLEQGTSSASQQTEVADNSIARKGETLRQAEWRDELLKSGIRGKAGQKIEFSRVVPLPGTRWLHADAETIPEAQKKNLFEIEDQMSIEDKALRAVISFGPEHAPLEQRQVELAIEEARTLVPKPKLVIFAAFHFDPEAAKDIDELNWPGITILKVQMNTDLLTDDLKKKRSSNESYWLIGQPDVVVKKDKVKKGEEQTYRVEVMGFDYFNTKTGELESGGKNKIAMWMLDTDYDGRALYPRQVFFPMAGAKDGWSKLAKNLKAEIDEELIEAYRGTESLPFVAGKNNRIAVKIVDDRGIESLRVMEI